MWAFHVIQGLQFQCIIGVDFFKKNEVDLKFSSQMLTINKESKIVQPIKPEISFDNERRKRLNEIEDNDLEEVQRWEFINI